jgi:hypothetical protein
VRKNRTLEFVPRLGPNLGAANTTCYNCLADALHYRYQTMIFARLLCFFLGWIQSRSGIQHLVDVGVNRILDATLEISDSHLRKLRSR